MQYILSILFCLPILCFAQLNDEYDAPLDWAKGFIVTRNNDTIHGNLKVLSPLSSCREAIIQGDDNKETTYTPKELLSYKIGSILYDAVDKERFMQVFSRGVISLYGFDFLGVKEDLIDNLKELIHSGESGHLEKTFKFFVKKNGVGLKSVDIANVNRSLRPYISDDLELTKKVNNEDFLYIQMPLIIDEYNHNQTFFENRVYFNSDWQECSIVNAKYFRLIKCDTSIQQYVVETYYLDGKFLENKNYQSKAAILIADAQRSHSKSLILSNIYLLTIPIEVFQMKDLEELILSKTYLVNIPLEIIALSKIKKLDLSHNNLVKIPSELVNLQNLEELDLSYNMIKYLPPKLFNLRRLKKVNFSFNNIKKVPKEIGNLNNLEYLSFMSTKITRVPKEIGNLKKLRSTDIIWNSKLSGIQRKKIKKLLPNVKL